MTNWSESLVVFDLETTGVRVEFDRVVTAHVGRIDASGAVLEHTDWLVNPGVPIPEGAAAVHGITTERAVAEGRDPATSIAEIVDSLTRFRDTGVPLVAYNAAYDLTLLHHEARRYGIAPFEPGVVIDPLIIDKAVDRYRKGKRTLTVACEVYGVALGSAHEASADAIAAGRVAQALARQYPNLLELSPADLHSQQQVWQREQAESFAEWKRRNGEPGFIAEVGWPVR
ncbi:MAG: 3'-5' exonuclease [Agromyces sp.]